MRDFWKCRDVVIVWIFLNDIINYFSCLRSCKQIPICLCFLCSLRVKHFDAIQIVRVYFRFPSLVIRRNEQSVSSCKLWLCPSSLNSIDVVNMRCLCFLNFIWALSILLHHKLINARMILFAFIFRCLWNSFGHWRGISPFENARDISLHDLLVVWLRRYIFSLTIISDEFWLYYRVLYLLLYLGSYFWHQVWNCRRSHNIGRSPIPWCDFLTLC